MAVHSLIFLFKWQSKNGGVELLLCMCSTHGSATETTDRPALSAAMVTVWAPLSFRHGCHCVFHGRRLVALRLTSQAVLSSVAQSPLLSSRFPTAPSPPCLPCPVLALSSLPSSLVYCCMIFIIFAVKNFDPPGRWYGQPSPSF